MSITNLYLAQSNAGTIDGSSCANAKAASYFNSSSNWGTSSTQIGGGTTIHLCGTISTTLTTPTSQGIGLITVIWETGAKMSAPNNTQFFRINNTNAWKFNGGFPCGPQVSGFVTCNGIIENTANGTNLAHQTNPVTGFDTSNATGAIEITGVSIRNLYVHTAPIPLTQIVTNGSTTGTLTCSGTCGFVNGEVGLTIQSSSISAQNAKVNVVSTSGSTMTVTYPTAIAAGTGTGGNIVDVIAPHTSINCINVSALTGNLTVHDGECHDASWAFPITPTTTVATFEAYNLDVSHIDHAFVLGGVNTNNSATVKIHDCHIHNWANWDSGAFNEYHHDGFHFFNSQNQVAGVYIYNNLIDSWDGQNNTAPIFNQVSVKNAFIFNNVFKCDASQGCTNAPASLIEYGGGPNQLLANNTLIGSGVLRQPPNNFNNGCILMTLGSGAASSNNSFINNLITSCNTLFNSGSGIIYAATTTTAGLHHNLYANYITDGNKAFSFNGSATNSYATWASLSGETNSSLVSSAGIDQFGVLQTTSPATGAGANLTPLCTGNLTPLCSDTSLGNSRTPVARPTSAAWDIGAFVFSAGSPPVPIVSLSPVSLKFLSQTVGTTSGSQNITLTNTGTATLTISSVFLAGTNPADFGLTNGCGSTLNAGNSCTFTLTFTPSAAGARAATLNMSDNASGSPHVVNLTGTGGAAAPIATVTPLSINFSNVNVGVTSASQNVSLVNNGTATLTISSIAITGVNAADFSKSTTCGGTLAIGVSCQVSVSFTPSVLGVRSAALTITDNDANSPQVVSLAGTGGTVTLSEIIFNDGALGATVDAIKSSAATVYYVVIDNSLGGVPVYVKFFNLAAGSVTLGTTTPDEILYVPSNSRLEHTFFSDSLFGKVFPTALSAACVITGGTGGTTAPASQVSVTLAYS